MKFLSILLTGLLLSASAALRAAEPYNVLVLMCDEHNPHIMACAGDPLIKTPTFDSLAATGVRFTAAYCQNPICVPSRVSLVTGKMPCHMKTFGNTENQNYSNVTTLADVFTKAGYQTVWFGKTHWGDPRFQKVADANADRKAAKAAADEKLSRLPQDSKISDWPVEKNLEHLTVDDALDFLDKNKDQKFFMGVSLVKPHFPFTIQQKYYDMYAGKVTPPRDSPELIEALPMLSKKERLAYNFAEATRDDIMRTKAIYYGMVTYVDEELGRVLKKLDDLGLRDKTIIIYTADHGEMLGDHGIWYKNSFFDGAATIPFMWSFPKELPKGKVVNTPAMNMDVFPTLCDLCNLPKPPGLEGTSLLPVLKGTDDGKDRYALSENYRSTFSGRMIRTGKWKYFFYTDGEEFLFDLQADPGEEKNLIKDPALRKMADELRQRALVDWVETNGKKTKTAGTQ